MTKNLMRLAIITLPIVFVIGLIRINFQIELANSEEILQGNYLAVGALTILFSISWFINIPLVRLLEKPLLRYITSYILMSLFIFISIEFTGRYVFSQHLDFKIHPFWAGLIFNTIILALTNFTIIKTSKDIAEIQLNELKRLQLEAEKKLLVQQLQPHFLFNALSTLKSLINEDKNKASDYTIRLSEFLRYTVASSKHDITSIENELEFTKDYIELQSERFIGAVQSEIMLPSQILQMKMPVFSLQTAVENAFKHNLFSVEKPLHIKIWYDEGFIKIQNNKNKKKLPVDSTGTGLKNLDDRYQLIANTNISIIENKNLFVVCLKPIEN